MKKLLTVAFGMLFVAGFAFGQSNVSDVDQVGNGNAATVTQAGSSHESYISQNTWGDGHTATVEQSGGSGNFSDILQDQRSAEAYVDQIGSSNESRLKQSGPNSADITQDGEGNILGSYSNLANRAYQKNGTSFPNDNNTLVLDQAGSGNKAGMWQEHHAQTEIHQDGTDNESYVYQSGSAAGPLNKVLVYQDGTANYSDIHQDGEGNKAGYGAYGHDNMLTATQDGYDNQAAVDEYRWKDADNYNNTVHISQSNNSAGLGSRAYMQMKGDNNTVNVSQSGSWNQVRDGGMFPDVDAEVLLSDPSAFFKYEGDGSTITFTQNGNQNVVSGEVHNSGLDMDINQQGNVNQTFMTVGTTGILTGNMIDVDQVGNSNTATLSIESNSNTATVNQVGNNNSASITQ